MDPAIALPIFYIGDEDLGVVVLLELGGEPDFKDDLQGGHDPLQ